MAADELRMQLQDIVDRLVENHDPEDDDNQFLSIDLERVAKVWITFGGPNIWIELREYSKSAIHGAWASDTAKIWLSDEEESHVLAALGASDIAELFEGLEARG